MIAEKSSDSGLTWLRLIREYRGMSQQELAEVSGVSKVAISRLENSRRRPRWSTVRALSEALDADPRKIFPSDDGVSAAEMVADYLKSPLTTSRPRKR